MNSAAAPVPPGPSGDAPDGEALAQERERIGRARAGDLGAFEELFREHYPQVFRTVRAIVGQEHDARDVCQEVWTTVWRDLGRFRGDSRFTTWLHPIAVRKAIDHLRRRRRWFSRFLPFADGDDDRPPAEAEPADTADPRQSLEAAERARRFERALAALPPKHRAVLALREIEGLSYEEIARATGARPGTVMSRLFHARRLLARKLTAD